MHRPILCYLWVLLILILLYAPRVHACVDEEGAYPQSLAELKGLGMFIGLSAVIVFSLVWIAVQWRRSSGSKRLRYRLWAVELPLLLVCAGIVVIVVTVYLPLLFFDNKCV